MQREKGRRTDHTKPQGSQNSTPTPVASPFQYPDPTIISHRRQVKTRTGFASFNAGSFLDETEELDDLTSLSHLGVLGATYT